MLTFAESGHPAFRSTSPLSRGVLKSKGGGKLSIIYCADPGTIETVFRTIISVNQLSIYGAVSDLCEEYSSCRRSTGRLVVAEQSDPLFQKLWQNRRWANGIRVEYFPWIQDVAAQSRGQRFTVRFNETPEKSQEGLSSCRCSTTSHGDLKTIKKRMRVKCSTRFSLCEEIWSRTMVILRTWIREKVVLY